MNIKIKERITGSFGDSISEVIRIITEVDAIRQHELEITFDFSDCQFPNPFLLVAIHFLSERYANEGLTVKYILDCNNHGYKNYIDLVHFPNGLNIEDYSTEELEQIMQGYSTKTYVPLIKFSTSKKKEISDAREKAFSALNVVIRTQCNLPANLWSGVAYLIDEAINNILDHSQSEKGAVFTQYYPAHNYLDLCVADKGIGLLNSYKNRNIAGITTDKEAMFRAINGLSTKEEPESRGFGISTSKKMLVAGLDGKYFLYSGRAIHIDTSAIKNIVEIKENQKWGVLYYLCGSLLYKHLILNILDTWNSKIEHSPFSSVINCKFNLLAQIHYFCGVLCH